MSNDIRWKVAIGTAVMLVWLFLVLRGLTPVAQFVDALRTVLELLGVYHVVKAAAADKSP